MTFNVKQFLLYPPILFIQPVVLLYDLLNYLLVTAAWTGRIHNAETWSMAEWRPQSSAADV